MNSSICIEEGEDLSNSEKQNEIAELFRIPDTSFTSPGKDSVILTDDMVSRNFKGQVRQVFSYQDHEGTNRVREKVTDTFAAILIRVVGFKDIYNAWEE
mmetsp:Transcript_13952/g.21749  ORF Transcript_13952/g.21749 Transcript_13952/m.21749 type:complete len:99 (+) Transcript_13952:1330-1626(+)